MARWKLTEKRDLAPGGQLVNFMQRHEQKLKNFFFYQLKSHRISSGAGAVRTFTSADVHVSLNKGWRRKNPAERNFLDRFRSEQGTFSKFNKNSLERLTFVSLCIRIFFFWVTEEGREKLLDVTHDDEQCWNFILYHRGNTRHERESFFFLLLLSHRFCLPHSSDIPLSFTRQKDEKLFVSFVFSNSSFSSLA
jgi:hypothetical protein